MPALAATNQEKIFFLFYSLMKFTQKENTVRTLEYKCSRQSFKYSICQCFVALMMPVYSLHIKGCTH